MELKRVKEILKERKFKHNKELSEYIEGDYSFEVYVRGKYVAEIYYVYPENIQEIFISISGFRTDENEGEGINLREGSDYKLTYENFKYCLDLQENPRIHVIKFCKFYLDFSKWVDKELMPVLNHLKFKKDDDSLFIQEGNYFQVPCNFYYERTDLSAFYLYINPLTFKVSIGVIVGKENIELDFLYGEPSDIIFTTLDDIKGLNSTKQ